MTTAPSINRRHNESTVEARPVVPDLLVAMARAVTHYADVALTGGGAIGAAVAITALFGWAWALLAASVAAIALGMVIK